MGVSHLHVMGILFGGGVAVIDFDNDGFEDLYLTGGAQPDKLYRNINGKFFKDVTATAGISVVADYVTMAVSAGDYNNDGYKDLFISTDNGLRNLLLTNNGNGTFTERAIEAGIGAPTVWSMGSAFGDIDLDGDLDLYVINYIKNNRLVYNEAGEVVGFRHDCFDNELYLNNGDGTFSNVTSGYAANNDGCGLAVRFTDINYDKAPDIYIANDFGEWVVPNSAYLNTYPDPGFINLSDSLALNSAIYGMGIAAGDPDEDGLLDYYVTNIGTNVFHHQQANGVFVEKAVELQIDNTESYNGNSATSWGTFFFDFDNDSHEDLFVCNGYIGAADFLKTNIDDPNKLFKGDGQLGFIDVSIESKINSDWVGRGAVYADWDNDGYQDIVVANTYLNEGIGVYRTLLYKNTVSRANHWLKVKLQGTSSNRDAYGATLRFYVQGRILVRQFFSSGSHSSHHSNYVYVGLGPEEQVDSIQVIWPSGLETTLQDIVADQTIQIVEGELSFDVIGCMDAASRNYNPSATVSSGCDYPFGGCRDIRADNYDKFAEIDNGSCIYTTVGLESTASSQTWSFVNPVKNVLSLAHGSKVEDVLRLQVIDDTGKVVFEYSGWRGEDLVLPDGLKSGIYIVSAYTGARPVKTQKLLIQQ